MSGTSELTTEPPEPLGAYDVGTVIVNTVGDVTASTDQLELNP